MKNSAKISKNIIIVGLIVAIIGVLVYIQTSSRHQDVPAYSKGYIQGRNAQTDFNQTIEIAKKSGKKIFMIGGGDWCPYCRGMDKFFKNDKSVKRYLFDNFEVIKVYTGRRLRENHKFFSQFIKRIPSTPHFLLFTKEGKFIKNYETTPLEIKGTHNYSVKRMMDLLTQWKNL